MMGVDIDCRETVSWLFTCYLLTALSLFLKITSYLFEFNAVLFGFLFIYTLNGIRV